MALSNVQPRPDEMMSSPLSPHGTDVPYARHTTADAYPSYMATTVPCALPYISHFINAINGESYPGEEALYSSMNYGYIQTMEVPGPTRAH
ncbi:hypothetical protein PG989_005629 [Apiospora arundinis]